MNIDVSSVYLFRSVLDKSFDFRLLGKLILF